MSFEADAVRALLDTVEDPMWALDHDLVLRAFNPAFETLMREAFGFDIAVGASVDQLPPEVARQHRAAYERVLAGAALRFDWNVPQSRRVFDVHLQPVVHGGSVVGIAVSCRDVTDRTRNQGDFVAQVSHELRTPLNAIVGFTDMALDHPLGERPRGLVQKVRSHSVSLLHLVNDLLDLAQIEAGLLDIAAEPCDWCAIVTEVVEHHRPLADERGLHLSLELRQGVPRNVVMDGVRLRQIATHLISNALKFTSNGSVSVVLKEVRASEDARQVELSVEDTGIGISKTDQKQIFSRFYRAYQSRMGARTGSTGLGLTITRALVEQMGGGIRVRSTPGSGSMFRVRLPTRLVVEEEPELGPQRRLRILLADDNPDNLAVTSSILERLGDSVRGVTSGQDALDACQAEDFDLVLMDVDMHPMDGLRTTIEIRARESLLGLPPVPVVALTAHVTAEARQRCLDSGMDAFLTKPVDPAALVQALARHTDRRCQMLLVDDDLDRREAFERFLSAHGVGVFLASTRAETLGALANHRVDTVCLGLPPSSGEPVLKALRMRGVRGPLFAIEPGPWSDVQAVLTADAGPEVLLRHLESAMAPPKVRREIDPDIADLVPMYLDDRRKDVVDMRERLAEGDLEGVRKIAHRVRGTGTSYGYPELTDLGATLEDTCRAGEVEPVSALIDAMERVLDE